ncbi:MAG: hypothetical protein AAGA66_03675 [Bacteroidota bacterium]
MKSVIPVFLLIVITSCASRQDFDLESETALIMKLHEDQRTYHFEKDSISFPAQFGEGFISVNRGEITRPTFEENKTRYHRYFSSVDFKKWDDQTEPEIFFSRDGTMAYTIVDKQVVLIYQERDTTFEQTTNFAWVTIYTKASGDWKIACVASTNKPSEIVPMID